MSRKPQLILSEIRVLIEELQSTLGGVEIRPNRPGSKQTSMPIPKGALGAITMLINEGYFNTPKEMSLLMEKLKEMGHYHKRTAVAMNLLNLTKRRVLNRFKNVETKNWEYVIRK